MKVSRQVFFYLAVLFALGVAIQVFIAGYAIFVDPVKWQTHTFFIRFIEFIPILMLIFSFTGKLPKALRWQSLGLILLIAAMYATANITRSIPAAGALHPVVALIMFWMAVKMFSRAWSLAYRE